MAEQDKKIYISAREFINSWEKEIYQLSNLDLFAFLLINELASAIEGNYFKEKSSLKDMLFLYSEEIGALCFNMADSLQLFFEKNCFGTCNLNCPIELNKKAAKEEWNPPAGLAQMNIIPSSYYSKEQCLHHDMFNYVIIDSLIDFYNYEMGTVLDEDDERLVSFADYIVRVILGFIKTRGQVYLTNPKENASDSFNELVLNDQSGWQDILPDDELDEDEEVEPWKVNNQEIEKALNEFYENCRNNEIPQQDLSIIIKLKEYFINFLELERIEEIALEDMGEFLTAVFPNEMIFSSEKELSSAHDLLKKFAEHLEFVHHSDLALQYLELDLLVFTDVLRTIGVVQRYNKNHSYINHLLNSTSEDNSFAEGFMRITYNREGRIDLEDIHLKSRFEDVDLKFIDTKNLHEGDILHLQISNDNESWKLYHLEMVYCAYARYYLL